MILIVFLSNSARKWQVLTFYQTKPRSVIFALKFWCLQLYLLLPWRIRSHHSIRVLTLCILSKVRSMMVMKGLEAKLSWKPERILAQIHTHCSWRYTSSYCLAVFRCVTQLSHISRPTHVVLWCVCKHCFSLWILPHTDHTTAAQTQGWKLCCVLKRKLALPDKS